MNNDTYLNKRTVAVCPGCFKTLAGRETAFVSQDGQRVTKTDVSRHKCLKSGILDKNKGAK